MLNNYPIGGRNQINVENNEKTKQENHSLKYDLQRNSQSQGLTVSRPFRGFAWYYSIGMAHSFQWRKWLNGREAVKPLALWIAL